MASVKIEISGRATIVTMFLGPTSRLGSRVKIRCGSESMTVPWDHASGEDDNHAAACEALCARLGRSGSFVAGRQNDGSFVFVEVLE